MLARLKRREAKTWKFDTDAGRPERAELARREVPLEPIPTPAPPTQPDSREFEMRGQGVHTNPLRTRTSWSEAIMRGSRSWEDRNTREYEAHQEAWEESRARGTGATSEEVKHRQETDPNTRPLDPSSSSRDPDPKRVEPGDEDRTDRMDEGACWSAPIGFLTGRASLKESTSNVVQIRAADDGKFDVNEEDWPNADTRES